MFENHADHRYTGGYSTSIKCDVHGCQSRWTVGENLDQLDMRIRAAERGWVYRRDDFTVADFCPSHDDRGTRAATVDTLRVFRDRYGDLAYHWPGIETDGLRANRPQLYPVDDPAVLLAAADAEGWTELVVGVDIGHHRALAMTTVGDAVVHVLADGETCTEPHHRHVTMRAVGTARLLDLADPIPEEGPNA
jgi:hypothetical protein